MYKVAVLLASYNGALFIKEQVNSILNQKDVDVTIFISDDLSKDKTIEFLQCIYKNEKRLIYLESNQKFGSAARNFYRLIRDVNFSNFDFISLADQDDIWYEDKLIRAIKTIEEKQLDAYSSNVLAFWENGKEVILQKAQSQVKYDHLFEAAGPGCTYVLTQRLANNLKKFIINNWEDVNQVYLHDWLIYAYSRENNYKWYIDKTPTVRYRQHELNYLGANSGLNAKYKRLKLVSSSWYRNETIKLIKILNLENKYKFTKLILNKSYLNNILLLQYVYNFRRKTREKLALSILIILGIY